jgi:kinesin family protein C2/C3
MSSTFYGSGFSRPKAYDPALARRAEPDLELASLAERIAETQRRTLRRELGLSDSEGEPDSDEDAPASGADVTARQDAREEFEQLQSRYMTALNGVHEVAERERRAVEQLNKLKQMSKSQVSILRSSYKTKFDKHSEMVESALAALDAAKAPSGAFRAALEEHRAWFAPTEEADRKASYYERAQVPEDAGALRKQLDSLSAENDLLRQCLADLSAGKLPLRALGRDESSATAAAAAPDTPKRPKSAKSIDDLLGGGGSNNLEDEESKGDGKSEGGLAERLGQLDAEALRGKLIKALKVTKHAQSKLAASEADKEALMALLNEARTELERLNAAAAASAAAAAAEAAAPAPVPAPAPAPALPPRPPVEVAERAAAAAAAAEESDKAAKIRDKFDRLKQRCAAAEQRYAESEQRCSEARALLDGSSRELAELRERPQAPSGPDPALTQKLSKLEAALVAERQASASSGARSDRQRRLLGKGLRELAARAAADREAARATRAALAAELARVQQDAIAGVKRLAQLVKERQAALAGVVQKYERECKERKRLFNLVQELRGNIRVLCRVRPVLAFEQNEVAVKLPAEGTVEVRNPKGRDQRWEFDHVFPVDANNAKVFEQVSDLCTSVLDGYNVCIFAYGQTGSGKTHTMEGSEADRGVNYRALELLFNNMEQRRQGSEWRFAVQVSLLEIYNEQIRDLLEDRSKAGKGAPAAKLEVKAGKNGMHVPGLTTVTVTEQTQILRLMQLGKRNRATASTQMNADSSRSHSMLSVYVEAKNLITGDEAHGKLHLIDLAGSERISKSGVKGQQLTEATSINKSLSSLGDVIQARANKQAHVPYRNSTLTYLLQDSLGNDSKTLMVVQCSPVQSNAGETICSLNFAARARTVELGKASKHSSSSGSGQAQGPSAPSQDEEDQ